MIDLSTKEGTITQRVESLISTMENLDYTTLRNNFVGILQDRTLRASQETRDKWLFHLERNRSKLHLMTMITNLYLAGCNLKTIR